MSELRETLQRDMGVVPWKDVAEHAVRDRVIIVAAEKDLIDIAVVVAEDDTAQVGAWIDAGVLRKPTQLELGVWNNDKEKHFRIVICDPWVLIQDP